MDVFTKEKRSEIMSRIRGSDTSIEIMLRKALWRAGVRYRKNDRRLPGKPDIAIPKGRLAVFCDGDFWHGRNYSQRRAKLSPFWRKKLERNMERDRENEQELATLGWTYLRFWGTDIKKDLEGCVEIVLGTLQGKETGHGKRTKSLPRKSQGHPRRGVQEKGRADASRKSRGRHHRQGR